MDSSHSCAWESRWRHCISGANFLAFHKGTLLFRIHNANITASQDFLSFQVCYWVIISSISIHLHDINTPNRSSLLIVKALPWLNFPWDFGGAHSAIALGHLKNTISNYPKVVVWLWHGCMFYWKESVYSSRNWHINKWPILYLMILGILLCK